MIKGKETFGKKMKRFFGKSWGWLFLLIPILLQVIFFYFPMFQGAFYSLTNWTGLTYRFDFVGLNNYKIIFTDSKFISAIGFTIFLTVGLVIGEILFGIWIAKALNSKIKGKSFFRAWFFFPAVLSSVTISLVFKQIFNYGLPEIGNLTGISFLKTSLLGTQMGAIFAVLIVMLWQGIALPTIIFFGGTAKYSR